MTSEMQKNSYQIIPRKYRPQTFASVICQDAIVTTLKNALRLKKLAQAYLFCGSRGTGKTTLARVFAKALNCTNPTSAQEPCNQCPSCQEVSAGRSLDVLEIDGASNRGIDDIRQINETIGYAPANGKFKIYIIDEVHMLTKEAFNALLKTLEEPPPNVKFFFATTEPHKVLPTIISRCQRFDLGRISPEGMQRKLSWIAQDMGIIFEDAALMLIAQMSEGSLRDAESLFDQVSCYAQSPITLEKVSSTLGLMPREIYFQLDQAISQQTLSFAFELAHQIFTSGRDVGHFLENLMEHFRTLLFLKLHQPQHGLTQELQQLYVASLPLYTEEQCLYILDYLMQAVQQQSKTPFKQLHLEMLLLHLVRSKLRVQLPALVRRLCTLENNLRTPPQTAALSEEGVAKLQFGAKSALFVQDPDSAQIAYSKSSMTICERNGPAQKSSNLASKASFATPSEEVLTKESTASPCFPTIEENLIATLKSKIDKKNHIPLEQESPSKAIKTSVITPPAKTAIQDETLLRFTAVELEGIIKKN